ncbi:uncharacterized protein LOC118348929 [Juglans regia]|uniref:Uncharacterized protein LOC118348929 n=1 Tax=Juglans regia TaxID=51240 RepID=A0A6P9EU92_JUGRE|nr:uncharacterized protein LOC118348929 [Juglans regia]
MEKFRNALDDGGLRDLRWKGIKYTWSNGHGDETFIKERLDRAVANIEWRIGFDEVQVETVLAWCSDHLPILLSCSRGWKDNRRYKRFFRYEMCWDKDEDCGKVIERAWKYQSGGVQNKLISCRQALCHWSKEADEKRSGTIKELTDKLKILKETEGPEKITEIKLISGRLSTLLDQENVWWKQRANSHWLQQGDRNTKYFHACATQRRKKNTIVEIENAQGQLMKEKADIDEAFMGCFSELFTTTHPSIREIEECISSTDSRINEDMRGELERDFSF